MFTRLPKVSCPSCKQFMTPSGVKSILFANGLQEITYTCESCGTTTVRSINPDKK